MIKKYILAVVVLISGIAFSQNKEEQREPQIRLKVESKQDRVLLRWAVDEPVAWQKANKIGFVLKRYTLIRDGKLLENPEEKNLGIFQPASEEKWKAIIETNNNAAIVAQSMFGESFEVEMGNQGELQNIINKSQEIEQRFAYALMAADLDFEVAQLAGWGYVDTDVEPDVRYVYTVKLNPKNNTKSLQIEKGSGIAELSKEWELPKPLDFIGIFKDQAVTLSWNYFMLRDTYTSYYIEKSEDGTHFTTLSNLPVMNMNDTEGRQVQGMVFVDSLAQNNKEIAYRIRGKTIFGDYGPYSEVVSGEGKKSLEISPSILDFDIDDNENITITWDFPKESESEISSFELLHSETDLQNSYQSVKKDIPVTERKIVTKSLAPSNYFKVEAIGKSQERRESFAILVQPNDITPPDTPANFRGEIDSLGVVHLDWKVNTEKDLEGYHIFRGIQKGDELVRITPQAITQNTYQDTIVLENLNSKVYYYVTATDKRKNQSKPSVILELEKPDKVRPQAPVFTGYKLEDNGNITLNWLKSYSDDVAVHQLYRKGKDQPDTQWEMIYETKKNQSDYSYTDKAVVVDKKYVYYLQAIDKSKLKSDKSQEVTLQSSRFETISVLSNMTSTVNRNKKQIELIWRSKTEDIIEIVVYRQKGNEKPTHWGTLAGNQNFLEDTSVQIGNRYTYLLKPMLKNSQVAKTEKIDVEY
ncbi:Fibronectin type-III domain-containing protein [Candidatus Ornithobacterium hominis]|uniref:fibronectin type III domain-containing protein n=1 Tax=Candidatus Ornithobacterium hominis TaxID=2497989 RepID=UPI0024BCBE0A|nr:hypothetical protein [Candidatus Ornithobacterium hominis]CAI9429342.1 Fibronectin type-III domain-containing protein [Candidatus Ornithobacterium hominis]